MNDVVDWAVDAKVRRKYVACRGLDGGGIVTIPSSGLSTRLCDRKASARSEREKNMRTI